MADPAIYLNPFNKLAAHHRPIGKNAQLGIPAGFSPTNKSQQISPAQPGVRGRVSQPTLTYRLSTGPLFDKLHVHNDPSIPGAVRTVTKRASGNGRNLPVTMRLPTNVGLEQYQPNPSNPGSDSNPGVYDVGSGLYSLFHGYYDNKPEANIRQVFPLTGVDHPGSDSFDRGTSAASIRWPSTTFHFREISGSNPPPIRHPFNVACTRKGDSIKNLHLMNKAVCWPAWSIDGLSSGDNQGDLPYGTLVFIGRQEDYDWLLANYSWTNRQKVVLDQQRYYGTYILDGTGTVTVNGQATAHMSVRPSPGFTTAIRAEVNEVFARVKPFLWPLLNGRGFGSENELWTDGNPYRGGGGPIDANSVNDAYDADSALPPPPQSAEAAMPTLITAGAWPIVAVP